MTRPAIKTEINCPHCDTVFMPKRSDQMFCNRTCSKAASRNSQRGDRKIENGQRTNAHYELAIELSHKLNRMNDRDRHVYVLSRLKAATDKRDPSFLNLITDPKLIGAKLMSGIGLSKIDSRYFGRRNIAKIAYDVCKNALGMSVKAMLKDKPTQSQWDGLIERAKSMPERPYCPSAYYIETQLDQTTMDVKSLFSPRPKTTEEFFTRLRALRSARPLDKKGILQ